MVSVQEIRKSFGNNHVLRGISFNLQKGEFAVVLGSSGAGKSTLLRCINGLCKPNAGKISINGTEVNKRNLNSIRKKVGFIFQNINVVGNLTVMQNVLTGRLGYKAPWNIFFTKEERDRAIQAIEMVGLLDKIHTRTDKLSGGQKQRVGIARVLVQNPDIILADEPVASLDPVTGQGIMELLKKINHEMGTIILCNLHQLEYAIQFGQRVIGISEGNIQFDKKSFEINDNDLTTIYGKGFGKTLKQSSNMEKTQLYVEYNAI